ncbi:hypothetical protein V1J52_03265 [Streptomyces sp. TRM 70351]|uniref:bestrophin-like domain n=1 Tax=Streptomyces sp. TRM 70351 TaxID=3116552 RepID=UPI002E7C273E|nr:hypothetical protein [Streptomyces sp. TRM 70351]MEE1927207.1 hypothetical protein [Streptomyces sp. TRM 70351]
MPIWLVLALAMTVSCGTVITLASLRRRRRGESETDEEDTSETPDVVEYMIMMIGVVYAIVLGLAIAGVWEERNSAAEWVRLEAQALHEVHERVAAYPEEVREQVRGDVDAYVAHTVGTEWPRMTEHGELSPRGDALLDRVREQVAGFEPAGTLESHAYQGLVDQVAAAHEARTARSQSAGTTMPGLVWFGLLSGAVVVVGMIFALQIRRNGRELLLAGLFTALIAFLLFLIWAFDAPYARGLSESTEPFLALFPQAAPG